MVGERLFMSHEDSFASDGNEALTAETDVPSFDEVRVEETPLTEQELVGLLQELDALELCPIEGLEALIETPETIQETPIDYDIVYGGLVDYDFDGKEYDHAPELLGSLLEGFTEDHWSILGLEGQKEQMENLYDYVNDVLGLENPPQIEYYYEAENGSYGGYNPVTNTLQINEYMLYDSAEAADTVAHELWHAYQHERAANPRSPKDFQYQYGLENYIRPEDDFDGYQSQLVEAEARAFADQFKGELAHMRKRG